MGDAEGCCIVGVPEEHAANASRSPPTMTNWLNTSLSAGLRRTQGFIIVSRSMAALLIYKEDF